MSSYNEQSTESGSTSTNPYRDSSTNLIYNLLFCDNLDLYKDTVELPYKYPYDVLFSDLSTVSDLQKVIDDSSVNARLKVLSYNKQRVLAHIASVKELLAVIVEVGLENGLDTLASYRDGSARYINQTGKMIIWEATDQTSNTLTNELFSHSLTIVNMIGAWDKPRRPAPAKGIARITFLVSDGLYFGEGPIQTLFSDPMARPALMSATSLMKYLTETSLGSI